jgi:uncharacterized protein
LRVILSENRFPPRIESGAGFFGITRAIPLAAQTKKPKNLFVVAGHSAAMGVAYMTPRRHRREGRRPMTPEERNLVIELFDRLATLEDAQRDPEAERLIRDGLRQAPNAPYALVQTVLVQDEALKRADARIRELEGSADTAPRDASFLGGMRESLFGRREGRGSVPSVRPPETAPGVSSAWRTGSPAAGPAGAPMAAPMAPPMAGGGSFLGTAAAAAAGVIGGTLLLDSFRSMMGHRTGAQAAFDPTGSSRARPGSTTSDAAPDPRAQAAADATAPSTTTLAATRRPIKTPTMSTTVTSVSTTTAARTSRPAPR